MNNDNKIVISGTGRCGTTFLMILLTYLKLPTGFSPTNFHKGIAKNCNSGLENINLETMKTDNCIIKHPELIDNKLILEKFLLNNTIEYMVIPIRNFEKAAMSRANLGGVNGGDGSIAGGLWKANNYEEQLKFYYKKMTLYLECMVKYDIFTIFLDFDKMISNQEYLYNKLIAIFEKYKISLKVFKEAYIKADNHQKKIV